METLSGDATKARNQLNRLQSNLRRYVTECDVQSTKTCLQNMKAQFEEFEGTHYQIIDGSENQSDIEQQEKWYADVLKSYLTSVNQGNKFLKEVSADYLVNSDNVHAAPIETPPSASSSQSSVASEIVQALAMPKLELEKFSGSPLEYKSFMQSFEQAIGSKVLDDKVKLNYLMSYVTGEARTAIKPCLLLDNDAFAKAKSVLQSRFGNPVVMAQVIIQDLKNPKKISKASDLQKLSDSLSIAAHALLSSNARYELNSQEFIKSVVDRCPPHVKNKWANSALQHKEDFGEYPVFENLCKFIREQSVRASDPYYGQFAQATMQANALHVQNPSNAVTRTCKCCGAESLHSLDSCPKYMALSTSDRYNMAKSVHACFACLKFGHQVNSCRSKVFCTVPGCNRKHHTTLHRHDESPDAKKPDDRGTNENSPDNGKPRDAGPAAGSENKPVKITNSLHTTNTNKMSDQRRVALPIVKATIHGIPAVVLLDSGSNVSLMSRQFADRLHLSKSPISVNLESVGQCKLLDTYTVNCTVNSIEGNNQCDLKNVLVVNDVPTAPGVDFDASKYKHLHGISFFTSPCDVKVDLLVGLNDSHLHIPLEVRRDESDPYAAYAVKTPLGWILVGMATRSSYEQVSVNRVNLLDDIQDINDEVQNLWNLEHDDDDLEAFSANDEKVLAMWERDTQFDGSHYVVPVPWKPGKPCFPNNKYMAQCRLNGTIKKLNKLGIYHEYDKYIQDMISDKYAEVVPDNEITGEPGCVWYIPHHAVFHPVKKKLRVVFDCAAKQDGICLNSECYQGPDLVNKLVHVLLRFRLYESAFCADLRRMYMQVKLPQSQRDCFRFLWKREGQVKTYRMSSHLFGGVFCASSSTYALRKVVQDFECSQEVRSSIENNVYVDDLLHSDVSVDIANSVAVNACKTVKKAGFDLLQYMSNDPAILEGIPETNVSENFKEINEQADSRVLGLRWNVQQDCFVYKPLQADNESPTKRSMLSQVASLYDPLGFVLPVILVGRLLFQEAVRLKLDWDDPVPDQLALKWDAWLKSLHGLTSLSFPRCIIPNPFVGCSVQIHHYSDGSEVAFGTVSYLRIVSASGDIKVSMLASKGRVASLKPVTIPRLELSASMLSVKQDLMLRRELDLPFLDSVFWTDSRIVLAYIANEQKRFKTFVANRLSFIRKHTKKQQWRYVASKENPADIVSRGCDSYSLPSLWMQGPEYLGKHDSCWNDSDVDVSEMHDQMELKKVQTNNVNVTEQSSLLSRIVNHYRSFDKMCHAVVWLTKFVEWLRTSKREIPNKHMNVSDIDKAKCMLIKCAQHNDYSDEINRLSNNQAVKCSSSVASLNPYMEAGIIRVGGRLSRSSLSADTKHPILLPSKSKVTRALLQDVHDKHHLGVEWTASLVREKYWVPHLKRELKSIKRLCIICKMLYKPTMVQQMADLPPDRCASFSHVFEYCGLDVFGPFIVKRSRGSVKRYGCIFTCLNTRAVHIEVLETLDADSFINALVRFSARRGAPRVVRCDNGRNFSGGAAELKREFSKLDKVKVITEARRREIKWLFNPPLASHFGGVFERVIRSVKRILLVIINPKCVLTNEALTTALTEVEGVLNSRPLTRLSDDIDDPSPLTPAHLLLTRSNPPLSWSSASLPEQHRRQWRHVQAIVSNFWSRWLREYLVLLQQRSCWRQKRPNLKSGDLVLIAEKNNVPRGLWNTGVVTEVFPGSDGLVRSAHVRTKRGIMKRPITMLVSLESDS